MTAHRKRPRDPNQLGKLIIDMATGQAPDRTDTKKKRPAKEASRDKKIKARRAAAKKD